MLARHVSYLTGPSSGVFYKLYLQILYVVIEVIEGKIKGEMDVTRRRGRRRKKLLDDLKDRRGYSHLKEEALEESFWRRLWTCRQTDYWIIIIIMTPLLRTLSFVYLRRCSLYLILAKSQRPSKMLKVVMYEPAVMQPYKPNISSSRSRMHGVITWQT